MATPAAVGAVVASHSAVDDTNAPPTSTGDAQASSDSADAANPSLVHAGAATTPGGRVDEAMAPVSPATATSSTAAPLPSQAICPTCICRSAHQPDDPVEHRRQHAAQLAVVYDLARRMALVSVPDCDSHGGRGCWMAMSLQSLQMTASYISQWIERDFPNVVTTTPADDEATDRRTDCRPGGLSPLIGTTVEARD
ncbi:hypothetical protein NKR19_g3443 [Coniochaeta hoffmannii]|uniref:Uncharacterized protein n=1 Tax=Coniochaeta hoffmannii TaxID=91930 RepID=A0AA38VYW2_9PEZI|nr:hypothetical protein NKR19_g3443 [Coniochaeta hoffmannii]